MATLEASPERERLQFAASVSSAFTFLEEDFGYAVVESSAFIVRYEKADMFVSICHGPLDYELYVSIGRWIEYRGKTIKQGFTLSDVIALDHDLEDSGYRPYATTDGDALRRFVQHYAELVHLYARPLLRGDPDMFQRLQDEQERRGNIQRQKSEAQRLRDRAEEAFGSQDYPRVVRAYKEILKNLPEIKLRRSEMKRLDIARQHLKVSLAEYLTTIIGKYSLIMTYDRALDPQGGTSTGGWLKEVVVESSPQSSVNSLLQDSIPYVPATARAGSGRCSRSQSASRPTSR